MNARPQASTAPLAPAPNRIGQLAFRFDVDHASRQLGAPEKLLMAVRAELLDVIDSALAEASAGHNDLRLEGLDIDLGAFPDPPDWQEVRHTLRQRLLSELTPYLSTRPTAPVDAPIHTPDRARKDAPESAGKPSVDQNHKSPPHSIAPTPASGRTTRQPPGDAGHDATQGNIPNLRAPADAPTDATAPTPPGRRPPSAPDVPAASAAPGRHGRESILRTSPLAETLSDPARHPALLTELRWRHRNAATRLQQELAALPPANLTQLWDLISADRASNHDLHPPPAPAKRKDLIYRITQALADEKPAAADQQQTRKIVALLRGVFPSPGIFPGTPQPDPRRLARVAQNAAPPPATRPPAQRAAPMGDHLGTTGSAAATRPDPAQMTRADLQQLIKQKLPAKATELAAAIDQLGTTATDLTAALRIVAQALLDSRPVDLEKARRATDSIAQPTAAIAALLRAMGTPEPQIAAFIQGHTGAAAAPRPAKTGRLLPPGATPPPRAPGQPFGQPPGQSLGQLSTAPAVPHNQGTPIAPPGHSPHAQHSHSPHAQHSHDTPPTQPIAPGQGAAPNPPRPADSPRFTSSRGNTRLPPTETKPPHRDPPDAPPRHSGTVAQSPPAGIKTPLDTPEGPPSVATPPLTPHAPPQGTAPKGLSGPDQPENPANRPEFRTNRTPAAAPGNLASQSSPSAGPSAKQTPPSVTGETPGTHPEANTAQTRIQIPHPDPAPGPGPAPDTLPNRTAAADAQDTRHPNAPTAQGPSSRASDTPPQGTSFAGNPRTPIAAPPNEQPRAASPQTVMHSADERLGALIDTATPDVPNLRQMFDLIWSAMPHTLDPTTPDAPETPDQPAPSDPSNRPDRARFWQAALVAVLAKPQGHSPAQDALATFLAVAEPDTALRHNLLRVLLARLGYARPGSNPVLRRETCRALENLLSGDDTPATTPHTTDAKANFMTTTRAGLILFHPYLPMLFDRMGLLTPQKHIQPDQWPRAIAALAALADETPQPAPPDPLERLLLALPDTPPPASARLSEADLGLIDSLLRSVIAQWSRLGQTSPTGLRDAFVRRNGLLQTDSETPRLMVDAGPFDMLLDGLPWALTPVALPWMPAPLHVIWRDSDD